LLAKQFGASVLLNTLWDVDCIGHRSKSFRAVFNALRARRPATLTGLQAENVPVLKKVVDALGGSAASQHVQGLPQVAFEPHTSMNVESQFAQS